MVDNKKKNIPVRVGKDGRQVYVHNKDYVLTGARRCTAFVSICNNILCDDDGNEIGKCTYRFGADQTILVCPQCGKARRRCGKPALRETQDWESPLCKTHVLQKSRFYAKIKAALKDEEEISTVEDLIDDNFIDAIETLPAVAANILAKSLDNRLASGKLLKEIETFYSILERYKRIKGTDVEVLNEMVSKLLLRKVESVQHQTLLTAYITTYKVVAKEEKLKLHEYIRKANPALARDIEAQTGDEDLIPLQIEEHVEDAEIDE